MSERQKQTAFLKALIGYEDSDQRRALQERIVKAEKDERCIRRALFLVGIFGFFCLCGLGYSSVLVPEFFRNPSHGLTKLFCALGLGSLICFVCFLGFWFCHRHFLYSLHDECRHLIAGQMHSKFGPPPPPPALPPASPRHSEVYQIVTAVSEFETHLLHLPKAS
jgi:hypothetical protein